LMGLEGAGFLFVKEEHAAALRPNVAGWLSHEEGIRFLFEGSGHLRYDRPIKRSAAMFEGGNVNAVGCAALEASLDILLAIGPAAIWKHVNALLDGYENAFVSRGFRSLRAADDARRSCTLGLSPPADRTVMDIYAGLAARGVACATPDGVLRLSPHWPNAASEIPIVIDALDEVLRG